jgi:hypothetical protein
MVPSAKQESALISPSRRENADDPESSAEAVKARFADEDAADRALGHGLGISGGGYRASGDRVCADTERAIAQ